MCEEVCRLALLRRYRLIPHIYTLFYMAHMKGTRVAAPTFFADPRDSRLRAVENSFLLGPLLICTSTIPEQCSHELSHVLPKGIWLRFDFGDSHPDLPTLYLKGGSIIPVGPVLQYVGEANPADELSLMIALDKYGKAEGVLFEDDGDGYEYTQGNYLLTYYVAELHSSVLTVKVSKTEGSWERPKRVLHVQILLGGGAMIDARGVDGEELWIIMPSESEVSKLVIASENQYRTLLGTQWLHSRVEVDGYEEYSGTECRSAGCSEEYKVVGLVCLRVHPMFTLLHPTEVLVVFNSIDGSKHEIDHESGEQSFEGNLLPNGEWMLVDKCAGLSLVNRFDPSHVSKCMVHWGTGMVNLELWPEERPVSRDSPLRICHQYEVKHVLQPSMIASL